MENNQPTTGMDLSFAAGAGDLIVAMIQFVMFAVPLIAAGVLVLAHMRHSQDHAFIAERRTTHSMLR